MSKLVAVRIPDDLAKRFEGQNASRIVVSALEAFFASHGVESVKLKGAFDVAPLPPQPQHEWTDEQYARAAAQQRGLTHAETCRCLMCKPPR